MSDFDEARWYVVHTYSGYENKVASNLQMLVENRKLQDLIQDIRVPTETVTEIVKETVTVVKDGRKVKEEREKKREVERKVFPGYVLVKMVLTDDTWYIVRNTRGCTGFVGPDSKPIPLSDKEIQSIGVEQAAAIEVPYEVGDSVKIVDGKLEGYIGQVIEIKPEKNIVRVTISMFGRETPAELELEQVVALN